MKKQRLNDKEVLEATLIKSCVKGERWAQEKIYTLFSPKMYALCLRYSKDVDEAQELLQTGFIKVFTNINKFENKGSLEGWVRTVIVRNTLDSIKKRTKINEVSLEEGHSEVFISEEEATIYEDLSEEIILREVANLDEKPRLIFNLFHLDEMSHKEISEELNILESTSRSILRRAKTALKEALKKYLD